MELSKITPMVSASASEPAIPAGPVRTAASEPAIPAGPARTAASERVEPAKSARTSYQQHQIEEEGFRAFDLSAPVLRALDDLGFEAPTPVQQATIRLLLAGRD